MQIYNKSLPYSNAMLRARMAGGGRLLDVGGSENPQRANALSDIFSEMILWPETRIKAFFEIALEIPTDLCHEVYFRAG